MLYNISRFGIPAQQIVFNVPQWAQLLKWLVLKVLQKGTDFYFLLFNIKFKCLLILRMTLMLLKCKAN